MIDSHQRENFLFLDTFTKRPAEWHNSGYISRYGNWSNKQLSDLVSRSFTEAAVKVSGGNFEKLRNSIFHQLSRISKGETRSELVVNVLFIGGSVCAGIQCPAADINTLTDEAAAMMRRHCAYPARFIKYLKAGMLALFNIESVLIASSDCCESGSFTQVGIDKIKNEDYQTGVCVTDPLKFVYNKSTGTVDKTWEPDLIIWDYGVNDDVLRNFPDRMKGSREQKYEEFIQTASKMKRKPQIISFNSPNRFYHYREHGGIATVERYRVNKRYCVPTIDYLESIKTAGNNYMELTPYHAAKFVNNHVSWPTHVMWAELLAKSVLLQLGSDIPRSIEKQGYNVKCDKPEKPNNAVINPGIPDLSQFCPGEYSSFLRFRGGHFISSKMSPIEQLVGTNLKVGNWSFKSEEEAHDFTKTGWLYTAEGSSQNSSSFLRLPNSAQCQINRDGQLSFKLNSCPLGRVKFGFLSSYTKEWGEVEVSGYYIDSKKRILVGSGEKDTRASLFKIKLDSRWKEKYSLQSFKEISWKPSGPEVSNITVSFNFCIGSGYKFKLESIGCC